MSAPSSHALADHTWCELTDGTPTVLLPLGSCEQHGPHLPLDTDTAVSAAVAHRAAETQGVDVLVAPAQPYGASGEHEGFAGTISIGHEALELLLVELGRSLRRWAPRLLVINGHGGNVSGLTRAVAHLRAEGQDAAWWQCSIAGADAHAGRCETSLMSALRPDSVRSREVHTGRTEPVSELMPALARHGVFGVSPNGVLGDPTLATVDEGLAAVTAMAERLTKAVTLWHVEGGVLTEPSRRRGAPDG